MHRNQSFISSFILSAQAKPTKKNQSVYIHFFVDGNRKGYVQGDTLAARTGTKMCKFHIDFYIPAYFCTFISLPIITYIFCYMQNIVDTTCLHQPYSYCIELIVRIFRSLATRKRSVSFSILLYRLPWPQDTVEGWAKTMIYSIAFAGAHFTMNANQLLVMACLKLAWKPLKRYLSKLL